MNSSKRALIFEAYPFFSGSQKISRLVCETLKADNWHVTLLAIDDRFGVLKQQFSPVVDEFVLIPGDSFILRYGEEDSWFRPNRFLRSFFMGVFPFSVKTHRFIQGRKFDVLYCCDPRGATLMLGAACLFKGIKILHFHGKNRLPAFLSRLFLRIFSKVICVSQDVFDSLPPSSRKSIIYNGIDFEKFRDDGQTSPEELQELRKSHDDIFLYAGIIKPHKGLHHAIDAFISIYKEPNFALKPALVVLGDAKTPAEINYKKILQDKLVCTAAQGAVYWMGWKSNTPAWFKNSNYFLFPTVDVESNSFPGFGETIESSEGLPTVLIEASLTGTYSLASSVTGVAEIITEGVNGSLYDPKRPENLETLLKAELAVRKKFSGFPSKARFDIGLFEKKIQILFNS